MKECPKCHATVKDEAKFCHKCGFNIKKYEEENAKEFFCFECGTKLEADSDFCPECGTKVSDIVTPDVAIDNYNDDWLHDLKGITSIDVDKKHEQCNKEQIEKMLAYFEYESHMDGTYTITGLLDKNALTVIVPKGVKSIGVEAFADTNIMQVTLPEGLMVIDNRAFYNCKRLSKINFPDSLALIGESAFESCADLSFTYPNVKKIGKDAFCGTETDISEKKAAAKIDYEDTELMNRQFITEEICSGSYRIVGLKDKNVQDLYISAKVTCIDLNAFKDCEKLRSINVSPANVNYHSVDGVLYQRSMVYIPKSIKNNVDLPIGVNMLTDFDGCENITSVVIPESITEIPDYMFRGCENLVSVVLHDAIVSIGKEAFKGCKKLKSISIPASVHRIDVGAFEACSSLAEISIPEGIDRVPARCFAECKSLEKVILPTSLLNIGNNAFANCTALKHIDLPELIRVIEYAAFSGTSISNVKIPQYVVTLGNAAFINCSYAEVKRGTKALFKDAFGRNCSVNVY